MGWMGSRKIPKPLPHNCKDVWSPINIFSSPQHVKSIGTDLQNLIVSVYSHFQVLDAKEDWREQQLEGTQKESEILKIDFTNFRRLCWLALMIAIWSMVLKEIILRQVLHYRWCWDSIISALTWQVLSANMVHVAAKN